MFFLFNIINHFSKAREFESFESRFTLLLYCIEFFGEHFTKKYYPRNFRFELDILKK